MSSKRLTITNHAYLRYAERVMGLDLKLIQASISQLIGGAVEVCPDCRVPFTVGGNDFVAVVKNRAVLTIVPMSAPPLAKPKRPKALRPIKGSNLEHLLSTCDYA